MIRHSKFNRIRCQALCGLLCLSIALCDSTADARVQVGHICSIQGQKEQKLVGMGLVVGLKGTGDGGKFLPETRALAAALSLMDNPVEPIMLKDVANVAIVWVEATIPGTGIRRGQKVDCYVSSIGASKSLRSGRLILTPLQSGLINDNRVLGLASGTVYIEDPANPATGKIPDGVVLEENFEEFASLFIQDNSFSLLLDKSHASFFTASAIADAVNKDIAGDVNNRQLAKAVSPGEVRVTVPDQYRDDPVNFVGQVLEVGLDNPHVEARVVLNAKSGTVVVTGEVEISPVVIAHKSLSVTVGDGGGEENPARFVPVMEKNGARQTPQHLQDLVAALNQLKVPTTDIIDIIKDLHRSGKLHAVLISE